MGNNSNSKKDRLLGIPHGTANGQLRKMLVFDMAKRLGLLDCYRCKEPILKIRDFSIEHKIPWQSSEEPKVAFFDLENIAFSHLSCNSGAGSGSGRTIIYPEGQKWCGICKSFKSLTEFPACAKRDRSRNCKECHSNLMAKWRERTGRH
jgi:hypothetical protein